MRTRINSLFAFLIACTLLQSCLKNGHPNLDLREDKLLLSKLTGLVSSNDPNFYFLFLNNSYTYQWSGRNQFSLPDSGAFQLSYNYGSARNGWGDFKPVEQESFINTGHYDFTYNNLFPDKVIDNSSPGQDFGYWKFYYDRFGGVDKVGLAVSSTSDPIRYEFYSRNWKNQIDSFAYGKAIDTSFMKVTYQYDPQGNIAYFYMYLMNNVQGGAGSARFMQNNPGALSVQGRREAKLQAMRNFTNSNKSNALDNDAPVLSRTADAADTFSLYLTAKVTVDGKVNPFSQQGDIFFYQTNRWYSFYDITPFFISLLKSNPVRIEYDVPYWGPTPSVQTFSYTYNEKGYPLTVHEEFSDPDFAILGNYTRDSQIEYIKNE